MRRLPSIQGYVVTELADAYWEANGLLDFGRNPKAYYALFSQINAPDVIMAHTHRYAYWDDEAARVTLYGSNYGDAEWAGGHVRWTSAAGAPAGQRAIAGMDRGRAAPLGTSDWPLPKVEGAQPFFVELSLHDRRGRKLAENSLELLVLPSWARDPAYEGTVLVRTRDEIVASPLAEPPGLQATEPLEGEPHGLTPDSAPLPGDVSA